MQSARSRLHIAVAGVDLVRLRWHSHEVSANDPNLGPR